MWKSHILSTDLNANGATDVVADANDNIWVATNSGLKKYNGTIWTSYKKANSGLPSDFVQSIASDSKGVLWVGTQFGLASFNGVLAKLFL
ncbi:MAG: hypothetical protein IPL08_09590 [Saprospiraceae bacterium]|nr:hypothetical protein [Saprospiraceae bacterium]